ncbi:hypothetical protein GQR58_021019 [Nymphon striatum]|nr:hypothetical protein GQR58_021019 [Nymphon striatum]
MKEWQFEVDKDKVARLFQFIFTLLKITQMGSELFDGDMLGIDFETAHERSRYLNVTLQMADMTDEDGKGQKHRDVRPSQIRKSEAATVKVIDASTASWTLLMSRAISYSASHLVHLPHQATRKCNIPAASTFSKPNRETRHEGAAPLSTDAMPVPSSTVTPDGFLLKTDKSKDFSHLTKSITDVVPPPDHATLNIEDGNATFYCMRDYTKVIHGAMAEYTKKTGGCITFKSGKGQGNYLYIGKYKGFAFKKVHQDKNYLFTAYDYGSIMQYPKKAFSTNGLDTIEPIFQTSVFGQSKALSNERAAKPLVPAKTSKPLMHCGFEHGFCVFKNVVLQALFVRRHIKGSVPICEFGIITGAQNVTRIKLAATSEWQLYSKTVMGLKPNYQFRVSQFSKRKLLQNKTPEILSPTIAGIKYRKSTIRAVFSSRVLVSMLKLLYDPRHFRLSDHPTP